VTAELLTGWRAELAGLCVGGAAIVVGARFYRRPLNIRPSRQEFTRFCLQVTGASLSVWFALAFFFLTPGLANDEVSALAILSLGLVLCVGPVPLLVAAGKFGVRSLFSASPWQR
jgi:uncharacterized membrane-anchored protein